MNGTHGGSTATSRVDPRARRPECNIAATQPQLLPMPPTCYNMGEMDISFSPAAPWNVRVFRTGLRSGSFKPVSSTMPAFLSHRTHRQRRTHIPLSQRVLRGGHDPADPAGFSTR